MPANYQKWKRAALTALVVLALAAVVTERHHLRRALKRGPEPAGRALRLSFVSPALGRQARYWVYLPPGFDPSGRTRYPVLYLLHGMFRSESTYLYRVDADLVLERLLAQKKIVPLLLVMPEGDLSFYLNWKEKPASRWEDFIVQDLLAEVDQRWPTVAERSGRALSGFSMGGFGALRLALLYPDRFAAASSQYGVLQINPSAFPVLITQLLRASSFDLQELQAQSPLHLLTAYPPTPGELAIYLDAGEDDAWALDEQAREFSRRLSARGIPHTLQVFPGNHTDAYLRQHFPEILRFHSQHFPPPQRNDPSP